MKAYEARLASTINAAALAKKKEIENAKRRVNAKKHKHDASHTFLAIFAQGCRDSIKYAVEDGKKSTQIALSEDNKDIAASPASGYDYVYGENLYQDYLKNSKFGKEVKIVMRKLVHEGYKVEVESKSIEHDESAAYMNSGGECGSETPWWTANTYLTISWRK